MLLSKGMLCVGKSTTHLNDKTVLKFQQFMRYLIICWVYASVFVKQLITTGLVRFKSRFYMNINYFMGQFLQYLREIITITGISLKLVGGGKYYGRVEVTHDNHTGTICDSAWSTSDARVVCKYLGFADGDPVTGSYYGGGSGAVMMNGLGCYGYESNIVQCRNKGWMSYAGTDCQKKHKNDASVVCYKDGEYCPASQERQ